MFDHLFEFGYAWHAVAETLLIVYFNELGLKVGSHTVTEFLNGVNASSFQQFCKLTSDTVDAEKVGMVRPGEDELRTDAGFLCQCLATSRCSAFGEIFFCCLDACSLELFSVNRSDSFDVSDFVRHNNEFKSLY